jgi:basic amino acid/polyamine antiporter, APA family
LGWNSVIGWIITVSGALCIAAVFARLARVMPKAGGPYAYTTAAFGPAAGFAIAWAYWISMWVGNAAIATGAVSYLSALFPPLKNPRMSVAATIVIVWIFTLINLAIYVLFNTGLSQVRPFRLSDISAPAISSATILTLWAMLGLETATVPADKVSNPQTTIPRATMFGTAGAGIIYIFVCSAVVLMLPSALTATSPAPFADFVARYGGADAGIAIAAFGAISALGALNGWILVQGELPAAMARDGLFPNWMGRTDGRGVPRNAHLFTTGLLTIVLLLNTSKSMTTLFEFLILLTTAIVLVMYFGCALAAIRLMATGAIKRTAGFIVVTALALIYSLWTIYGAGGEALAWGALLLLAGVPIYLFMKRS